MRSTTLGSNTEFAKYVAFMAAVVFFIILAIAKNAPPKLKPKQEAAVSAYSW